MEEGKGVQCVWGKLNEHPKCPHGPTLLFGKYTDGDLKQFYACSACRDRKLCSFYLEHDNKLTKQQKQSWELEKKKKLPRYDHQKMFIRYNEMMAESPARRVYCHSCERLFFVSEKDKHRDHDLTENLTDHQMTHPTEFLKPLENAKREAQYLFSKDSTQTIVKLMEKLGAEQVLCIGAPRIHEYITNNLDGKMSSLLLDFDGRLHNFFGPLNYCWYNLFNHHFFHEDSQEVFKDFLVQNGGKRTFLICDPPFGGRVEPMSQTIKTISEMHKKLNSIASEEDELKIMFVFPYFMEPAIREKSNPPGIAGGLKSLKMSDYKVDYDNHPLFAKGPKGRKQGSPVRIFTNIDLQLLELPEAEGYKYCKRCRKWVARENKHCKKCKECTSKDGRRYRHCEICQRCVKPTWKHCEDCQRCVLEKHKCGQTPRITGRCNKCNEFGHVERDCGKQDTDTPKTSPKSNGNLSPKKRKNDKNIEDIKEISIKKKKKKEHQIPEDSGDEAEEEKLKTIKIKKVKRKKLIVDSTNDENEVEPGNEVNLRRKVKVKNGGSVKKSKFKGKKVKPVAS